jgi:glucose/arabinose dehydrogenase
MKTLVKGALLLTLAAVPASAQINAGEKAPEASLPFTMTQVASFNLPWRIAFLPDGRMLVTEKVGPVWLVTQKGEKTPVQNVPQVLYGGQGGMLGVFVSPHYASDHSIYLTYSEPNEGGSSLALAKARLALGQGSASLEGLKVIWHDPAGGKGGQFGGQVAFAPDGKSLFLSSGDRQRFYSAQESDAPMGKILHLTLDGKPAADNPMAGQIGGGSFPVIDPPKDTEAGKTAPVVRTYIYPGRNETLAETWTTGHRTPYGLAFAPNGQLWEMEHGPKAGDELNLIQKGRNYGWPLVSYGPNYDGVPIPNPDTRPDLTKPVIYWAPVIAPGSLTFYNGNMFPAWKGSAFVTGMKTQSLSRITFDGKGGATPAERWAMGHQIRDMEVAPDGAMWMLENANPGGLFRVTPK